MKLFDRAKNEIRKQKERNLVSRVVKYHESQYRLDIQDWRDALASAKSPLKPSQRRLQEMYGSVMTDALLSSQMQFRTDRSQSADFTLVDAMGKTDEEATAVLKSTQLYNDLSEAIVEAKFYGQSVMELSFDKDRPVYRLVPRTHVDPINGVFYPDVFSSDGENYRERPDYGTWILEFNTREGDYGLLNNITPHVLMKRFAQSCWSELCEVYGIPPLVLKTNTSDPEMLERCKQMLQEAGSNAKYIADIDEEIEWATGTATNGDVFNNLISLCSNEISMCVLGAVVGQDTVNGNRSKEESSLKIVDSIILADHRSIEAEFNGKVLPALNRVGLLPEGLCMRIREDKDMRPLWDMVYQASQYYEVDPAWIRDTFGIEVTGRREFGPSADGDLRFFA
jgi:hypothetical protein